MSFLYPYTVTVTRPAALSGIGTQSYQGLNPATETTVLTNVPASIQQFGFSKLLDHDLPSNINRANLWRVFFGTVIAANTILDGDVIIDNLNRRFQVSVSYWNSLGYRIICERLEI